MSKLILHIGAHKTGTTSIQQACSGLGIRHNAKHIDVRTPKTNPIGITGFEQGFRARIKGKVLDRVLKPHSKTTVISSEGFFWIDQPDEVAKIAKLASERFDSVKIVAYVRRQDQAGASHQTQVMRGGPSSRFFGISTDRLPRYCANLHRYYDYHQKLVNVWGACFGMKAVEAAIYDRAHLIDGDVVADFAARCDVSFPKSGAIARNLSPGREPMTVGLTLMQCGVAKALRKAAIEDLPNEGKFLPTKDEARAFLAHFSESNERLVKAFAPHGIDMAFSDSFDMYPDQNIWTEQETTRMITAITTAMQADKRQALSGLRDDGDNADGDD